MQVTALKTKIYRPGANLIDFIDESVPGDLRQENCVLAITSKIVSLAERRTVSKNSIEKRALVEREADYFLGEIGHGCFLTIKEGLLIPSAGIDESNSESGDYILYPADPFHSARELWSALRKRWDLKNLGIIITDSHTTPLRRGVTGIGLSYAGFSAVKSLIGSEDLFGRQLRVTTINYLDGLSAAAVLAMGEGAECQPLAWIGASGVDFCETIDPREIQIPVEEDLYGPLLHNRLAK